ncbi:hypothetical protein FDW83_10090 [Pseudarthrobacter sp. NamE2]|uniref:hypothetical protein n=1 Tax=Pseudarthrobacter sp. NamE2 TaxID=2576838 RepID=UPI0010FCDE4D|nr:hypothetical protein [Pseudarthrobacter sp. NamE2]TLM83311.1 hypothetical protein FDW83_10090 [Pseudarthrobacter sp. NamE2]
MTLQSELIEVRPTAASGIPLGGSYITLPAHLEAAPRSQGSYVTLPGTRSASGSRAQGTYVTLHAAPAGKTEISYTRVG